MPSNSLVGRKCISLALIISSIFWQNVHAGEINEQRAINAIIGESEGEPEEGKIAIACAIRNRGTLNGVYGETAPRVVKHLYSEKTYYLAKSAWVVSESASRCNALIHGATNWEGTAFKTPSWAKRMVVTATIKNQRFYREK